ncbi:phosphoglyceromutase [Galbibacter sp.]|jgi:hypothetical protein|uniref:phosphoglyceromutase n=1 Tax=Galbibacter sp. TaxID=2918471 RepID=UPI003A8F14E0
MKRILLIILVCLGPLLKAQNTDQKVILITLDGLRWQELFTGADKKLITNKDYHGSEALKEKFWRNTPEERRKVLMPFVWSHIAQEGQIHGNRTLGSEVDLTNNMLFSYPGYNEILTGKADDKRINSNSKKNNPNTTVLEIINTIPEFKNKVFAFGSWDVFPFIINEERSGIPVNAGFETAKGENLTDKEKFLNELQSQIPSPWSSVRLDAFTHHYAIETMKKHHPNLIHIAYGETDDFAHDGDYSAYLNSAQTTDFFIEDLWEFIEGNPFYKGQTTVLITTDHGRGTEPLEEWKSHGSDIENAREVWFIAFGKGVKPLGEITSKEQLYTTGVAPTILILFELEKGIKDYMAEPIKL